MPTIGPVALSSQGVALASATFAAVELRWVPSDQAHVAALVALLLTVPLQLGASVLAFVTRDAASGTGAALLSGTWAVTATVTLFSAPGSRSPGLGVFLLVAGLALVAPVAAGASKPLAAVVMAGSAARFEVTGVSQLLAETVWRDLAGTAGLLLAALALYAALAYELETVRGHEVLPTGAESRTARVSGR